VLIRAKNGHRALELSGLEGANISRVTEDGPEGVVVGYTGRAPDEADPAATVQAEPEKSAPREVDITTLADKGRRRYRNLDTGTERTERRTPDTNT
jgi:hypothetical protein